MVVVVKAVVTPEYGIVRYKKGYLYDLDRILFYLLNNNFTVIKKEKLVQVDGAYYIDDYLPLYMQIIVTKVKNKIRKFESIMTKRIELPIYATFSGILRRDLLEKREFKYKIVNDEFPWIIVYSSGEPILFQKVHDRYLVDDISEDMLVEMIHNYDAAIQNTVEFIDDLFPTNGAIRGKVNFIFE